VHIFRHFSLRYGTEICNGFKGLLQYLDKNLKIFNIERSDLDESKGFVHDDGLLVLRVDKEV
jgi:hypothetical protein